jgi:hypothetical protein
MNRILHGLASLLAAGPLNVWKAHNLLNWLRKTHARGGHWPSCAKCLDLFQKIVPLTGETISHCTSNRLVKIKENATRHANRQMEFSPLSR